MDRDKKNLINCNLKRVSLILGILFFFLIIVGTISALGFGSSYLPKIDGQKVFTVPINYNKSYFIYPQNSEDEIIYVKINVTNEDGLIITEIEDLYEVPPGTNGDDFKIEMNIRFPGGVVEGESFPLSYSVLTSYEDSGGGVVQFSPVGYSKAFIVVAGEPEVDRCVDDDNDDYDNCNPGIFGDDGKVIDCNNNDGDIYPNAPKLKDGKDNNCDGIIDGDEEKPPVVEDDDDDSSNDDSDDESSNLNSNNNAVVFRNTTKIEESNKDIVDEVSPTNDDKDPDVVSNIDDTDEVKSWFSLWKIIGGIIILSIIGIGTFVLWRLYDDYY